MSKFVYVIALTLGLTITTSINAQENIDPSIIQGDLESLLNDPSISQGDLNLLKNLACMGNSSNPELQASLAEIESLLNQSLASYGLELTNEQLASLGAIATDAQLQLESEEAVANFCDE